MLSVKEFLFAHWPWFVVGAVLLAEDIIARSPIKSNSTVQLLSSWLRMIPVLGRAFAVLAPKVPPALLLVGALALSGCSHSPESIAYNSIGVMAKGTKLAAEELKPKCDEAQKKAMREAAAKVEGEEAKNKAAHAAIDKVAAQCDDGRKGLEVVSKALDLGIGTIDSARKLKDAPKDIRLWLAAAYNAYRVVVPMLRPLGILLPEVP